MKNITALSTLCLLLFYGTTVDATHYVGGEISYRCLGGMDYEINMVSFGDCLAIPLPSTWTMSASSANCGSSFTSTLVLVDTAIAPLGCNNWSSACIGGTDPGVQVKLYRDTITLPMNCNDWVFSAGSCCRYGTINNLMNPASSGIHVETTLNSVDAPCNSSPRFQEPPMTFICSGTDYCISNTAFDPDGDSLAFSIVQPYDSPGTPIPYQVPFSTANPFASSIGHLFDPLTGNHCFNPTALGSFAVAYRVDEYRGGVLIGSVHRDFAMNTLNCTGTTMGVVGVVTDTAGVPVVAGEVVLYEYGISPMSNPVVDTVNIGPGGSYEFYGLPLAQYIVKAVPDTASYPALAASYHRETHYWQYADPFSSICDDTLTKNITAVHQSNLLGSGYLEGYLGDLGLRSSFGDPWVGQEVFLETWPGSQHVVTVQTDSLGMYRFNNLPDGGYRILVDRPGNPMTGYYTVTVNGASSFIGLDYAGDPAGIHPFIATGLLEGEVETIGVYPNPAIPAELVQLTGLPDGQSGLSVYDSSGKLVMERSLNVMDGRAQIRISDTKGVYTLLSDNGFFARVVIH